MSKIEVPDLRGDYVQAGDTIAYAATDGRSGGIRVGKIVEIVPEHESPNGWSKVPTKIRVEVDYSSGYWKPGKPTLIEAGLKRFVKVGP